MSLLAAAAAAVLMALVVAWLLGLDFFHRPVTHAPSDEIEQTVRRIERAPQPGRFSQASVAAAVAVFLLVTLVLAVITRSVVISLLVGIAAGATPLVVESRKRGKKRLERTAAWPEAIRQIISGLRQPMSIHATLLDLAKTGPESLRPAFSTYAVLSRRLDSEQALEMVRRDLADPVSDRIIEVLTLSLEQGAAVTLEVLDELAVSVTEDLRLNETIRTMMVDVRIDAAAMGLIPLALLLLTVTMLDEWRAFYSTAAGQIVMLLGLLWSAIGVGLILFIVRIKPEPRVLDIAEASQ